MSLPHDQNQRLLSFLNVGDESSSSSDSDDGYSEASSVTSWSELSDMAFNRPSVKSLNETFLRRGIIPNLRRHYTWLTLKPTWGETTVLLYMRRIRAFTFTIWDEEDYTKCTETMWVWYRYQNILRDHEPVWFSKRVDRCLVFPGSPERFLDIVRGHMGKPGGTCASDRKTASLLPSEPVTSKAPPELLVTSEHIQLQNAAYRSAEIPVLSQQVQLQNAAYFQPQFGTWQNQVATPQAALMIAPLSSTVEQGPAGIDPEVWAAQKARSLAQQQIEARLAEEKQRKAAARMSGAGGRQHGGRQYGGRPCMGR